jgi:hypothetical protein
MTALRTAGYTLVQDDTWGDFTFHLGKTWIKEEASGGGSYRQYILIETQWTQDVVASAAALSRSLASSGHAVVNGIVFDTGKAEVKPDAAAVPANNLMVIAPLLIEKQNRRRKRAVQAPPAGPERTPVRGEACFQH